MTKTLLIILFSVTCSSLSVAQTKKYPLQIGDTNLVSELSWSPKNNLILTSSGDEDALRLWDVATGRVLWKSNIGFLQDDLELYWIRHSEWTSDQKFIVTGTDNGKLQLWDAATGKLIWNIKAHADSVTAIAISPDAKFVVSSAAAEDLNAELKIWEFARGKLVKDLSANQKAIGAIGFIDNNQFRVGNSLCQITIWSTETFRATTVKRVRPCGIVPQQYGWFVYSPHFTFLAAQSGKQLVITNTNTGKVFRRVTRGENSPRVEFSDDERMLHLPDSEILDIYANKRKRYEEFDDGVLNNDGSLIAAYPGYRSDGIQIFDTKSGNRRHWLVGHPGIIKSLAFSPDGSRFASGGADRIVRIWDTQSKKVLFSLEGHTDEVESVEFSDDGKVLTSKSEKDTITWNTENGATLKKLKENKHIEFNRVRALSPSGNLALLDDENEKPFRLVNGSTNETIKQFIFIDQLDNLVFCPDEKYFLAKPWWSGWQLWAIDGNNPIREFDVGYSYYNRVAFHPDGKTFITGGGGQNIYMFDLESGKTVWSLFPTDHQALEDQKAGEARRIASINRDKECARLADIENEPYKDKVYITFEHYGDMTPTGELRLAESATPKKSKVRKTYVDGRAIWLRLHNDSPIPISVPTHSMYLFDSKCSYEFSDGQKLGGLCDNREISIWLGLENKAGAQLPYGVDFGSSMILLPNTSVLFSVPRDSLNDGNAIRFGFTFQKPNEKKEIEDFGTETVLRFRESDLPSR